MKQILIQLDTDQHPSTFDRVVAVDADVDFLFSHGDVTPDNVEPLVHGAMFTRGGENLRNTAIFIGGSQVAAGEQVLKQVLQTFFGPVRVSVMMDSNGSNTTASAAVICAARHMSISETTALVLGGTGPVGFRVAQLLAAQGAKVRLGSRTLERAQTACSTLQAYGEIEPVATSARESLLEACRGVRLLIAAGAAGVQFMPQEDWLSLPDLRVAIDLNAVPPTGLGGINVPDKAVEYEGRICYGAVGVGGTKMKIHKAAVRQLFNSNDLVLDTEAIYKIGTELT